MGILYGAATDVALSVLKQLVPSFDEERLHDIPLSGHQLFYVALCYTHCGWKYGPMANMRSKYQCKTLF
ncbi:hypothetical protein MTO96_050044 [Rhipicephalus appendiculatus]